MKFKEFMNEKGIIAILISVAIILTGFTVNSIYSIPEGFELIKRYKGISEIRNLETGVHYYYKNNKMSPIYEFNGFIRSTSKIDK